MNERVEKPHQCDICGKSFPSLTPLKVHVHIHTGESRHECDRCRKAFASSSHLTTHKHIHTGVKPYNYEQCGKAFARSSHLTTHNRIHTGERPYKCAACGKAFALMSHLTRHKLVHTGRKPFKCKQCEKTFADPSHLTAHARIHTGEKPYQCNQCDKVFARSRDLMRHERIHTGEKPFKCELCEKTFADSSGLIKHAHSHTGEKPYKCDQCDKAFVDSNRLTRHKRIHTGVIPFKCKQCEKAFSDPSNLATHMRIHTGEKAHACDECCKTFARFGDLRRHRRMHTGEKPYRCDNCGKLFADSSNFIKHKRTHTGEQAGAYISKALIPKNHQQSICLPKTDGIDLDIRQAAGAKPNARNKQVSTRRNDAMSKPKVIIVTEVNMHEIEEEVLRELYTPPPGQLAGKVKKEEGTACDADSAVLYTPAPERQREELKRQPHDEGCFLRPPPASSTLYMSALTPPHQTYDYWPQPPIECLIPPRTSAAHAVAGITGTSNVISQPLAAPLEAPLASLPLYSADLAQTACAPSQSFLVGHHGDPAGTAPSHSYPLWHEQQHTWPHSPLTFSPYFEHQPAAFKSTSGVERPINSSHTAPLTPPLTPSSGSTATRLATPRDLVTPARRLATPRDLETLFSSVYGSDSAGSGSTAFGNMPTGGWNQLKSGGAFRCLECGYIAVNFDLLRRHHSAWHRTNNL